MLLSEVIKLYQERLKEHGDEHVVLDEDHDFLVLDLQYDKDLKVYKSVIEEPSTRDMEVLATCSLCGEMMHRTEILRLEDTSEDICQTCYEEEPECDMYNHNIYKYAKDDKGYYTDREYIKREGINLSDYQKGAVI